MRLTFHKTLFKLGKIRIGIGYTRNNPLGWCLLLFASFFYLIWYTMIGCLWMMYGVCILMYYMCKYMGIGLYLFIKWCFIKPIIYISKKIKTTIQNRKQKSESELMVQ